MGSTIFIIHEFLPMVINSLCTKGFDARIGSKAHGILSVNAKKYNKKIIEKLNIERVRVYLSSITFSCALIHFPKLLCELINNKRLSQGTRIEGENSDKGDVIPRMP